MDEVPASSSERDVDRAGGGARSRAWLDVPYAEKDEAKSFGARWDPAVKRWYDPRPPTPGLQPWAARPEVPDLLPGEDRAFGSGLFVDMVPRTCWFTNVRTCVEQRDWERLRRMITRRAGQWCEICGAAEDRGRRVSLEAHERWSFDEAAGVQTLRRLICVCSACHLSTHFGYANVTGRSGEALAHLQDVTGMTGGQAKRHIAEAGQVWTRRSRRTWALDLSMLTDAGITLAWPETPAARARTADRRLAVADDPLPPDRPVAEPAPAGAATARPTTSQRRTQPPFTRATGGEASPPGQSGWLRRVTGH